MGWRTIYIEESNNVSLYLDNIKIKNINEDDILIPLKDIDSLIIDNYKTSITSNLICKSAEYNINLVIFNINHMPSAQIMPFDGNCLASKIMKMQLQWDEALIGELWKQIVAHKIKNQVYVLQKHGKLSGIKDMLLNLQNSIEYFDRTNREGLVAKIYFRALFGSNFRRFDEDTINAGLNYGYIVLRTMISKSLVSKGLNTSIGLFHKGESNYFNLSDDIIEVFRPIIDDYVYKNLIGEEIIFNRTHRLEIIKILSNKIEIDGKKQTISNAIDIYIDSIINYFEKGSKVLFPSVELYDL